MTDWSNCFTTFADESRTCFTQTPFHAITAFMNSLLTACAQYQVFNNSFLAYTEDHLPFSSTKLLLGRSVFLLQNRFLALILPNLNQSG